MKNEGKCIIWVKGSLSMKQEGGNEFIVEFTIINNEGRVNNG